MMKKTNVPVGAALSETQITQFCRTANRRRYQRMSLIHKERSSVLSTGEKGIWRLQSVTQYQKKKKKGDQM